MIAKAKSISHGINDLNYITGVSANKKHPERIFHICDNNLPPGLDPSGIWNSMKLTSMSHPRLTNNLIRIEISPAPEHTKDFTPEDWKQLWLDFGEEFDKQEIRTRTVESCLPKQISKAVNPLCGCMRNPAAAYRTSTPQCAVSMKTETPTMTVTHIFGHNVLLKELRESVAGRQRLISVKSRKTGRQGLSRCPPSYG